VLLSFGPLKVQFSASSQFLRCTLYPPPPPKKICQLLTFNYLYHKDLKNGINETDNQIVDWPCLNFFVLRYNFTIVCDCVLSLSNSRSLAVFQFWLFEANLNSVQFSVSSLTFIFSHIWYWISCEFCYFLLFDHNTHSFVTLMWWVISTILLAMLAHEVSTWAINPGIAYLVILQSFLYIL